MKKELIEILLDKTEHKNKKILESLIKEGKVIVNNDKCFLPHTKFEVDNIQLRILESRKYVSRGSYKLLEAIKKFNIQLNNLVCLDIGSSTGGFVQVLLENNAKKVYAVDVGTNQLDYSLRINPKVIVYEKTNLKDLTNNYFMENIDFVSCDVSFISLKYVFSICKGIIKSGKKIMTLIKPQFEAPSSMVLQRGIVAKENHQAIIDNVINFARENGFKFLNIAESPILGQKSKNIEYISLFEKE